MSIEDGGGVRILHLADGSTLRSKVKIALQNDTIAGASKLNTEQDALCCTCRC
jgi:hypothetical protein